MNQTKSTTADSGGVSQSVKRQMKDAKLLTVPESWDKHQNSAAKTVYVNGNVKTLRVTSRP